MKVSFLINTQCNKDSRHRYNYYNDKTNEEFISNKIGDQFASTIRAFSGIDIYSLPAFFTTMSHQSTNYSSNKSNYGMSQYYKSQIHSGDNIRDFPYGHSVVLT